MASLELGAGPARPKAATIADANGDTLEDLVLTFAIGDTGIVCDDTEVSLKGRTNLGVSIQGVDTISTDCDAGCHP